MNGSRPIGVKRILCAALVGAAVCARGADAAVEGSIFVEKWDEEAAASFTLWRGGIDRPFRPLRGLQTDGAPCVSPDGRRVAYVGSREPDVIVRSISPESDRVGPSKIIGRLPLKRATALVDCTWSPGGRAIALAGSGDVRRRPVTGVWRIQADGSRLRELLLQTDVRRGGSAPGDPAWSRLGRIAFVDTTPAQPWITLVDADGGNSVRLPRHGHSPTWSPNGKRLVYVRTVGGEYDTIAPGPVIIADADGSDVRFLRRERNGAVAFSPDGRSLAYAGWDFGTRQHPFDRITITARAGTRINTLRLPDSLVLSTGLTWTQ